MSTRVLVVGEGPSAEGLAALFVDHGCQVSLAAGVAQAVEALKDGAFDVALAEAGSGAELSARLKGGTRLILTGGDGGADSPKVLHRVLEPKDYLDLAVAEAGGRKTLLMDERVDPSCHLTRHLEAAGFRVIRSTDGGPGEPAAMAFLDAGLSGWESWRRLRAAGAGFRAVMPAGPCGEHVAARFAKGETPVVSKDLSPADMDGLVGACLKAAPRAAVSVLLVDDDGPFRESIADFLRGEGFHIDEAGTAAQGLAKAREKAHDVIVSDYHLPDLSGVQMIERLGEGRADAKVIFLTGEADLDSVLQALQMRAQAYLSKPVNPDALLAALDRALRERRLEGQVKDLLRELSRANGRLERFDGMKSRFLSLVAHDIRSPLSGAIGFNDFMLVKNPDLPEPVRHGMGLIQHALREVNHLVEDLLDLGRVESGKLSVKPETVDVPRLAEVLKARFEVLAKEGEVTLDFSSEKAPAKITADSLRLGQIVSNLAGNALKHAGRGRHVWVSFSTAEDGGLAVDVRDDGRGIKPEELSKVFEPFYQGDDPVALKKGVGLGLAIVRELVEAHGGRVWVESEGLGKGCAFHVRLPPRFPPPTAKEPT